MAPHLSSPSHKDADDTTWDSEAFHKMSFNDSSRNPSFLSRIPWLRQSSAGRHGDSSKLAALEDTLPEYTHGIIRFLSTRAFAWICFGLMSLSFFLAQLSHNSSPSPSASLANLNTTLLSNATTSLNDTSVWPPDRRGDLSNTQNVAYLTMFTETVKVQEGETDYSYEDDIYFIGLRMLTYQLVHAPETRTRRNIPFIIMVTADVSMSKREQLEKDGAIILPVATITDGFDWINPGGKQVRWRDQLTKLHAWELVQYERILYIDGDMILMRCMDGIFDADQTNNTAVATRNDTAQIHADEAPMPEEYLIASMPETWWEYYSYPPNHSDITMGTDYINGGFILFKPDPVMFEYYLSVARAKDRFNPIYMEQSLLNYAHRTEGNMPSLILPMTWNNIQVNREAVAGRVASIHDKWWDPRAKYPGVRKFFMAIRWRMEAFYELRDNYEQSRFAAAGVTLLNGASLDYTI